MSMELVEPGWLEGFEDLETLAAEQQSSARQRMDWRLAHSGKVYDDRFAVALPQLTKYATVLANLLYTRVPRHQADPDHGQAIVHRSLLFGVTLGCDLVGQEQWGMNNEDMADEKKVQDLRHYVLNAPKKYLDRRPVLQSIVTHYILELYLPNNIHDAGAAGLAVGLSLMQTDAHLLNRFVDDQAKNYAEEINLWDGTLPKA